MKISEAMSKKLLKICEERKISIKKYYDMFMILCHIILFICIVTLSIKSSNITYRVLFGGFAIFHAASSIKDIRRRKKL